MHCPYGPAIGARELAIGFTSYTNMVSADINELASLSAYEDYSCSRGHKHWQLAGRDNRSVREGPMQHKGSVIIAHVLSYLSTDRQDPVVRATALTGVRH